MRYTGEVISAYKTRWKRENDPSDLLSFLKDPNDQTNNVIRIACSLLLAEATGLFSEQFHVITPVFPSPPFDSLPPLARAIKNELSKMLRRKMKELKLPLEVPYRKLVIEFLNVVFGSGQDTHQWWNTTLPPLLKVFFNIQWFPVAQADKVVDWRSEVSFFFYFSFPFLELP